MWSRSFIYFMVTVDSGEPLVKMGKTVNVIERLRSLEHSSNRKLEVLGAIPFRDDGYAFQTEQWLHARARELTGLNHRRDWHPRVDGLWELFFEEMLRGKAVY